MTEENDLERFTTRVSRPQDFEDFWQRAKTELAQMPLEPKVSPVASGQPTRRRWLVHSPLW